MDVTNTFVITVLTLLIGIIPSLVKFDGSKKAKTIIAISAIITIFIVSFQIKEYKNSNTKIDNLKSQIDNAKINTDTIKINVDTIIKMNRAASEGLKKIKNIDSIILGLNQETSLLVSDIVVAQRNLKQLSKQANALGIANVSMNDYIIGSTTGGGSYVKASLNYSENDISIWVGVVGRFPMRNVLIAINDDGVKDSIRGESVAKYLMDSTKLTNQSKRRYFQVKYAKISDQIYSTPGLPRLVSFNPNDYGENLQFNVWVESENGTTVQHLVWKNFRKSKEIISRVNRWSPITNRFVVIDSLP